MQTVHSLGGVCSASTGGPDWLRRLLNDDEYFREIRSVTLSTSSVNYDAKRPIGDDELCTAVSCLPNPDNLSGLRLDGSLITDDGLSCIRVLPNLESLSLRKTLVTDAGIQRFGHCDRLLQLDLAETQVSDRGLPSLARLQRLEQLDLGYTRVTERGLEHLAELTALRRLDLRRTEFLGVGFIFLAELPNLEELILDDTEIGSIGGLSARYLQRYADKLIGLQVLSLEEDSMPKAPRGIGESFLRPNDRSSD